MCHNKVLSSTLAALLIFTLTACAEIYRDSNSAVGKESPSPSIATIQTPSTPAVQTPSEKKDKTKQKTKEQPREVRIERTLFFCASYPNPDCPTTVRECIKPNESGNSFDTVSASLNQKQARSASADLTKVSPGEICYHADASYGPNESSSRVNARIKVIEIVGRGNRTPPSRFPQSREVFPDVSP